MVNHQDVLDVLEEVFTADMTIMNRTIPFFWTIVAGVSLCVFCTTCCHCIRRKKYKAGRPPVTAAPMTPGKLEMGETASPMTSQEEKSSDGTASSGDAPPPGRSSLRDSFSRSVQKAIGRPVKKWKKCRTEDGRDYYINQDDPSESVWKIPDDEQDNVQISSDSSWIPSTDESGREYYYNTQTGESRWTNPENDKLSRNEGLPTGWTIIQDKAQGRPYYYNSLTGESQWAKPTRQHTGRSISKDEQPHTQL